MGTVATAGLLLQLGGVPQDIHATHAARALGWRLQGGRREGGGKTVNQLYFPVLRIRIHRIHMFLGLPAPDPLVRGMDPDPAADPDPSIILQK